MSQRPFETLPLSGQTWPGPQVSDTPGTHREAPPPLVAGRYLLIEPIGQGGFGQVWRAADRLRADEPVALKLLPALSPRERRHVRREIVALRRARLPGIVSYRDDGRHGEQHFIVCNLVQGAPFPGLPAPLPWPELAPRARRLVQVVARLHDLGLVHRDLKPANVLVDRDATVTVLDLGLAVGRRGLRYRPEDFGATARYAAPELLSSGEPQAANDLYALGVMLYEALTGQAPLSGRSWRETLRLRARQSPPPFASDAPPAVHDTILRLLAPTPSDRPATAWEVLDALGGALPEPLSDAPLGLPEHRPASPAELQRLFHGPDPILHLPEDGARLLWERTAGRPAEVRAELAAWMRAGLGHWQDGRMHIERDALQRLASGLRAEDRPVPEDLVHRAVALAFPDATARLVETALGRPVHADLEALIRQGLVWVLDDGRLGARPAGGSAADADLLGALADALPPDHPGRLRLLASAHAPVRTLVETLRRVVARPELPAGVAVQVLCSALLEVRADEESELEAPLLLDLASHALRQEVPAEIGLALYEVQRAEVQTPTLEQAEQLLQAFLAVSAGDFATARALGDALPALEHEGLEAWRMGLAWWVRRGSPEEDAFLDALGPWAEVNGRRAGFLSGWRGDRAYRQIRMTEAAALHRLAAALRAEPEARIARLRAAAVVLLEQGELQTAVHVAEDALRQAIALRAPRYEALLHWTSRAARARSGAPLSPDPELARAALGVDEAVGAQLLLGEAVIAWRAGDRALAGELAREARPLLVGASREPARVLADLLALVSDPDPPAPAACLDLAQRARALRAVGIGVQALYLLGCRLDDPALRAEAAARLAGLPGGGHAAPLELLDPAEIHRSGESATRSTNAELEET